MFFENIPFIRIIIIHAHAGFYIMMAAVHVEKPNARNIPEGSFGAFIFTCLFCLFVTVFAMATPWDFTTGYGRLCIKLCAFSFEVSAVLTGDMCLVLSFYLVCIVMWGLYLAEDVQSYVGDRSVRMQPGPWGLNATLRFTLFVFFDCFFILLNAITSYAIGWCVFKDIPCYITIRPELRF